MKAFFSHSQNDVDKNVNDFFKSLCNGLGLELTFVSGANPFNPLSAAKRFIQDADFLIAIAVRRDKIEGEANQWIMPDAVQQEITFADGLGKKILLFCENGVKIDGFMDKMCTYYPFEREQLYEPSAIEKFIKYIHELTHSINNILLIPDRYDYEFVNALVQLVKTNNGYTWKYEMNKGINFSKPFARTDNNCIISRMWASIPLKRVSTDLLYYEWQIDNKRPNECEIEVQEIDRSFNSIRLEIRPIKPQSGGYFEFSCVGVSKYFNPISKDDIEIGAPTRQYDGSTYICVDGVPITAQIKKLKLTYEFPKKYGLKYDDFIPFVASHDVGIHYNHDGELSRFVPQKESLGSFIRLTFEIDNPKLFLMYGLMWNPPE